MEYIGYHGTTYAKFQAIQTEGVFTFKPRKDHWLGSGVYFFLDDFEKASWWASYGNKPTPVVLKATLSFEDNEILNLDTERGLKKLDEFATQIHNALKENMVEIKNWDEHTWQCQLIDMFMKKYCNYNAIVRTFFTTQNYQGPSRFQGVSRQLCVKKVEKIKIEDIETVFV